MRFVGIVAHSFVSALACHRVHRKLGLVALTCASLVAIATLLTKQHDIADAIGEISLAVMANAFWLLRYSRANIPNRDRRLAPVLALCVGAIVAVGTAGF